MSDNDRNRQPDQAQADASQQNPVKDPEEWTTGDEPMTGPQASYLRTLLQQAGKSADDLDESLTKAQASKMIDELQKQTGRGTDQG
jgi:hypothetical protein